MMIGGWLGLIDPLNIKGFLSRMLHLLSLFPFVCEVWSLLDCLTSMGLKYICLLASLSMFIISFFPYIVSKPL